MIDTKPKSSKMKPTVAEYLDAQINMCGKSQKQIAEEAGFPKPNIITMFKKGDTKLPLEKIGKFAKAIEVDPIHLFKICMSEYHPETWAEIQKMLGQPTLTINELEILEAIRSARVENPRIRTEDERQRVIDVINTLKADNAVN